MKAIFGNISFSFLKRTVTSFFFSHKFTLSLFGFLFFLLVWELAGVTYKAMALYFYSRHELQGKGVTSTDSNSPFRKGNDNIKSEIISRNLFGSVEIPLAVSNVNVASGSDTEAEGLELRGTIAAKGGFGYAVLMEKGKNRQSLVKVGQQIYGSRLIRVGRDFCVLERMGREVLLKSTSAPVSPLDLRGKERSEGSTITVARQDIMTSMMDLGQMFQQVRVAPYLVDGKPGGFQLVQIQPGSILQRMGFIAGDVMQEINNRRLVGTDDITYLFEQLRSAPMVTVTLLRNGKEEKIRYVFN